MAFTVTSALRWWRRECPDRIALSVDDQTLTYAELYAWSVRVGDYLSKQGVKAGDRVSFIGINSMEFAVLAIGMTWIGAINAPISYRFMPREMRGALDLLTPNFVFADDERMAVAADVLGEAGKAQLKHISEIAALRTGPFAHPSHDPAPDDVVFIVGTSGSTGHPKGVMETHRTVMSFGAEFAIMEPHCGSGGSFLSLGPFFASSGMLHLMQMIGIGNTIYIESQFEAKRALGLLAGKRITTFIGVPIFFERIAALPEFAGADLSGLRFAQTAGARISTALLAAWREKGIILRQAYGCTEAGGAWATRGMTAVTSPEKCGWGGIFSDVAVAGENGGFAPPGVPGEILVRGACVTPGYWRNPEATKEALRDGWLHTGDLGVMDETGHLTFVDRLKDIIISGGLNISAIEVERVISEVEGVEEVSVIAVTDAKFGETPLAVVYGKAATDAIVAHCKSNLSDFKAPRYIAFEAEPLPRLPTGKISKMALRAKYANAAETLKRIR